MSKFTRDLKTGRKGELRVWDVFAKHGIECGLNDDQASLEEWDVSFAHGGREWTVEVKYDIYEAKSGNVAVEYFNPKLGKLTGILATKSDLWAFVLRDESVWLCRTKDLLRCFKTDKCVRDVSVGGDMNASMRLYRREGLFDRCFFRMDGLETDEFNATLEVMLE